MPVDILLYAVIAAGLVFWLRSVLGTKHGDERERPNPFKPPADMQAKADLSAAPIMPGVASLPLAEEAMTAELQKHMSIADGVEQDLLAIARADNGFRLGAFMVNAQDAFVAIVESYAEGDRETLEMLLGGDVYSAFAGALDARDESKQTAQVEIHAVRKAEIIAAKLEKKTAYITIRFVADETNVVKDKDDKIILGNPDRVSETIDIWTYARDVKSRSPAWLVVETRDEDAADQDHKTVPDTK